MQPNPQFRHPAGISEAPELDLRNLPAPEPLQRALAAADGLRQGQSVVVLTPFVPLPLLDALASRGLQAQVSELASGGARVAIHCPRIDECGGGHCSCADG